MNNETALTVEVKIKTTISGLLRQAESLRVVDQETADAAGAVVAGLKAKLKEWEDYWREPKAKAKSAHAILCDREGEVTKRVKPIIARLSEMASAWIYAEREKFRKAKEDRERAEWEAKRKVEEAEKKVEAASGFEEAAAAIAEIPHEDLGPAPVAPVVEDAQFRDHWLWELEEFDLVPRRFLTPDKDAIDNAIAAQKDKTEESVKNLIPGIRIYNKPIMASKRRSI
ncbi:MAG TPA: hypothetical protein VMV44_15650 [Rectinemataceae bacterium]|nr:hypothetical protein [Rectinemataceae bacterium]